MRQFLESLIAFQVLTSPYFPVMKIKIKALRVSILAALFSLLFAYQLYDYTNSKYII